MTIASLYNRFQVMFLKVAALSCLCILAAGCTQKVQSNKVERNAIKAGNKAFNRHDFVEAVEDYQRAIDANPESEVGKLNFAMATLLNNESDSLQRAAADSLLGVLAKGTNNPDVSENALYTRANIAVYIGDEVQKMAQADAETAQQVGQNAAQYYKMAIEDYKEILRRKPGDLKVTQNLRITQLKLPPEDQNNNSSNNDNNNDNQENQDQEQSQPQQQQQDQSKADALNALQKREVQTRKRQVQPVNPERTSNEKPW